MFYPYIIYYDIGHFRNVSYQMKAVWIKYHNGYVYLIIHIHSL